MRVMITQNRDKLRNVVNGQIAIIENMENVTIFLKLPSDKLVTIYPVTTVKAGAYVTTYPIRVGYANTMCKAQGQTLSKVISWFDIDAIPPGTAHVALSRVKKLEDILFLTALKTAFFRPVKQL